VITITRPGLLTTVQDRGRPGLAHLGVPRSGALDQPALLLANRLVGNLDGAAGLETTLLGVGLRTAIATVLAVTGAPAPVTVDGEEVDFAAPIAVPAGVDVHIGPAITGVRSYVAFAGGIAVATVLGSRSTDTLSGLGPPPLRAGTELPLAEGAPADLPCHPTVGRHRAATSPGSSPDVGPMPAASASRPTPAASDVVLRLRLGPRQDWFTTPARAQLFEAPFELSVKSNRIGARLSGPALARSAPHAELPSEGIVLGAVQVPADGQPLIFLADHPTTGGYPVIGVIDPMDLPAVAQARPTTTVRFVAWT
jgi:biotin-dependent carboxylase-like uncharacterized protein